LKFIKRLLFFIVLILVVLFTTAFIFVKSIAVDVSDSDLPEEVYTDTGNLLTIGRLSLLGLILADEQEQYTIVENFMNYIILDSIRTNINAAYDPLGDLDTSEANNIIYESGFYIDYVYAKLNDVNQIVVCISFGTDQYMKTHSAIYLYFDIDINIEFMNITLTLTLNQAYLADKEISFQVLDFIFDKLDKTSIEESMTTGTLDLTEYTYSISLVN